MTYSDTTEMSAQQRAALIVWLLARGHSFTTLEIAQITGLTIRGAEIMMGKLGGQVPLVKSGKGWKLLTDSSKNE